MNIMKNKEVKGLIVVIISMLELSTQALEK